MGSKRHSLTWLSAVLITLPVLIQAHPENQQYLSFGNYCGRNTIGNSAPCDYKSLLGCNPHGICRCIEPRIMTYNGTSCVVLAGESCWSSEKVWLFDNITAYQRADYTYPCVENAFCNLVTKTCDCFPGFFRGADRKCSPKLHGKTCQTEEDCGDSTKTHLICNKRHICECNTNLTIFFSEEKRCRGIVGAACDSFARPCVPNADCVPTDEEIKTTQECRCKPGFSKSHDGSCLVAYNNTCSLDPSTFCNGKMENTICMEGSCVCRSGQIWDDSKKRCRHQLNSRCDDNLDCVEGMECVGDPVKRCICKEGYVKVDLNCHPSYGQPCENRKQSSYGTHLEDDRQPYQICNPRSPYVRCFEGICQCQPTEYYDKDADICRGLVDSYCETWGGSSYCTPHAVCVAPENHYLAEFGMCRCEAKFKANGSNHCVN